MRTNEPQRQASLFGEANNEIAAAQPIVNIASVPHYSPFRYPGGKTWMVPRVRQWLYGLPQKPAHFIEPFAGGASVGLTMAMENRVCHVTLVEKDDDVAAVWQTILSGDADYLINKILSFSLTPACVSIELDRLPLSTKERAWQTILRNRVNRGGILASGAGRIKAGENGKGMASRWYPQTLADRIRRLVSIAHKITFIHGDGMEVLRGNAQSPNAAFFIDPPYTSAGSKKAGLRLYTHHALDHDALFCLAAQLRGDFLMTYDNAQPVREFAEHEGFTYCAVSMKNTHHAAQTELVISRHKP